MELLAGNRDRIQSHLRTLGWLDPHEAITAEEPAGEGNMNRTLRVHTPMRSIILKQAVPFVAKYPDIPAPVSRLDVEAAFYRALADKPALARHMPRLIGYDPATHLLCLEDLGRALDYSRLYDLDVTPRLLPSQALANWLSGLHNAPVEGLADPAVFANREMRALNHAHIFEIPLEADNGLELDPAFHDLARAFAHDKALNATAARLGDLYLGSTSHLPHCLLHGDYYPGSWLLHDDTVKIIDTEFAFIGPPEFDIGVFAAHLKMLGVDAPGVAEILARYEQPAGFDMDLALAFAAMEIIRRILGVARLPLSAEPALQVGWLEAARALLAQT
jgi:5-methylthioribose kinase